MGFFVQIWVCMSKKILWKMLWQMDWFERFLNPVFYFKGSFRALNICNFFFAWLTRRYFIGHMHMMWNLFSASDPSSLLGSSGQPLCRSSSGRFKRERLESHWMIFLHSKLADQISSTLAEPICSFLFGSFLFSSQLNPVLSYWLILLNGHWLVWS